jgi:uncharacterized protein YjlB
MSRAVPDIVAFRLGDTGRFPNNPTLPVLVYRQIVPREFAPAESIASWFEEVWRQHGWAAAWRYGVYDFPHYHSTAHEVLGVYRGHASLRIGDRSGYTVEARAGDMLVLPAGTAHQNLGASLDFHVVGGYPSGQTPDLHCGRDGECPAADERIAQVPLPVRDPVFGDSGPLVAHWGLQSPSRTRG